MIVHHSRFVEIFTCTSRTVLKKRFRSLHLTVLFSFHMLHITYTILQLLPAYLLLLMFYYQCKELPLVKWTCIAKILLLKRLNDFVARKAIKTNIILNCFKKLNVLTSSTTMSRQIKIFFAMQPFRYSDTVAASLGWIFKTLSHKPNFKL